MPCGLSFFSRYPWESKGIFWVGVFLLTEGLFDPNSPFGVSFGTYCKRMLDFFISKGWEVWGS